MDESTYAVIASKLGLSTNFIIKDHYLMRLLQYISMYTNKELILTGGTAINKVYLKEKARFSEDADFELTFKMGINELITLVDRVIAKADDFFGVEKRLLKVYYQTDLKYKQPGIEDKVRLDIAFNEIAPKRSEFSQIEITSPFSSERAYGLNVYSLEELLARKLYAVYRRTEGKDLYDIFYSLGLADKKKFYQTSTRFFEYKKTGSCKRPAPYRGKIANAEALIYSPKGKQLYSVGIKAEQLGDSSKLHCGLHT